MRALKVVMSASFFSMWCGWMRLMEAIAEGKKLFLCVLCSFTEKS